MSILSWLFKNNNNDQKNKSSDSNNNDNNQIIFETEDITIIKTPLNIDNDESFIDEDYNYFDAPNFNNNRSTISTSIASSASTSFNNNISFNKSLNNHLNTSFHNNLPNEIVISFDTTGKMFNHFQEFKLQLDRILATLFNNFPTLKISIMAHGDYCDDSRHTSYFNKSISILPFTNNIKEIKSFVSSIEKTNGGDAPECYEYIMRKARELPWSIYSKKTFIIFGDDVPHPPSYTDQHYYWRNELHYLTKIGVKVYGIQCHNNRHAKLFYEELAILSNGRYVHLDNSKDIGDLILTISFRDFSSVKYGYFSDEILKKIIDNSNNSEYFEFKKKEIENKFYQLFQVSFTRERNSSINIRFPWWDIAFDVTPNPRFIWDQESMLFIENVISVQNEKSQIIPFASPLAIETTTTPVSSSVQRCSPSSSIFKSPSINSSIHSILQSNGLDFINSNNNNSSLLHQENNIIKTVSKPINSFSSLLFQSNSSFLNSPFSNQNNSSFSIAGMSIIIDKSPKSNNSFSNQQNNNNNNNNNRNGNNYQDEEIEQENESEIDSEEQQHQNEEKKNENKKQDSETDQYQFQDQIVFINGSNSLNTSSENEIVLLSKKRKLETFINQNNVNNNTNNSNNDNQIDNNINLNNDHHDINDNNSSNNNSSNNNNSSINHDNNNNSNNTSDNDDNYEYNSNILFSEFLKQQSTSTTITTTSTKNNTDEPPLKKIYTEFKTNDSPTSINSSAQPN